MTAHHRREREASLDAARFSAIFGQAQVGLSELSLQGGFLRVNDELCRMLGRSRETLLRLGVPDVTHAEDIAHSLAQVGRLVATGVPVSIDKRYVRPDGSVIWANSAVSRLDPLQPGQPCTLLAVTVDLSERTLAKMALADSEARFRALSDAAPLCVWQQDRDGRFLYLNPKARALFGADAVDADAAWTDLLHADGAAAALDGLRAARQEHRAFQGRVRLRVEAAKACWMELYLAPWSSGHGDYAGQVGVGIDISPFVEVQEQLMIANERLNLAIEGAGDGVWDWHVTLDHIDFSERMKAMIGFGGDDALDTGVAWSARIHPDDQRRAMDELDDCLNGVTPTYNIEYRMHCKNGDWKWILVRALVVARDASGQALRMSGTVSDISAQRQSQEVIWRHANFDPLTGLPNRRLFRDRLDQEVKAAQRAGTLLGLLFIDLDHFKEVNDLMGHDAGDQLLVQAAKRIQACVRASDTVARLGGDEFTTILTELEDVFDAEHIAAKINGALARPFVFGQEMLHLTGSIGITLFPTDGCEPEELIRHADQAMYVAKSGGRNRYNYFTPAMQSEAQERLRLIADLRGALSGHELEVYYQPVVELRSGRIVKAEALLRWHHPRRGLIMPAQFIPFAEESGLIADLGDWVFQQAAASARLWRGLAGEAFQISVNRSPVQFMARPHGSNWPGYLAAQGLAGHSMAVEITEAVLLNASGRVVQQLQQYRDAGMQVAIDDFGTGYSSLAYLKKFAIDYLKVDQVFIRDMPHSQADRAIVRSVTAMAHELGLGVIAEGIETAQQTMLLLDAGCDFGQGHYFSPAVPAAQFERLLAAARP